MRIGFDARMYGLEHAGIGRYVKNLLNHLLKLDSDYQYTVFLREKDFISLSFPPQVIKVKAEARHYSLKEQWHMPRLYNQAHLDLLHVPHFNLPLLYRGNSVVTIHDILWHQVKGRHVTTLSPVNYALKYQAYKLSVRHAVIQAQAVIVPSNWVKTELLSTFPTLPTDKIKITYEGIDPALKHQSSPPLEAKLQNPYFVCTGSAYPHKNFGLIFTALKQLPQVHLYHLGSRSIFLNRLQHQAQEAGVESQVHFLGRVSDRELQSIYAGAVALIIPSRSEGFGLPGIEAMNMGLPVISSENAALPEIYGQAALYFHPDKAHELQSHMQHLLDDQGVRQSLIEKGQNQAQKYSWKQTARQTLEIYHQILKS